MDSASADALYHCSLQQIDSSFTRRRSDGSEKPKVLMVRKRGRCGNDLEEPASGRGALQSLPDLHRPVEGFHCSQHLNEVKEG